MAIALLPWFGQNAHGAGVPFSLNRSAALAEFIIPGVPVATTATTVAAGTPAPFDLTVPNNSIAAFPASGQILLGRTELMTYDSHDADSFHITQRGNQKIPYGVARQHSSGTRVQLATTTTAPLSGDAGADAIHCLLTASASASAAPTVAAPIKIGCNSATGFIGTGYISITHQATELNQAMEYMQYDQGNANGDCATLNTAAELCIIARGLQPGNNKYAHKANGTTQPCVDNNALTCSPLAKTQIVSEIHKHSLISVKSNAGFFATGSLIVYTVGASNNIVGAELLDYNNAASKVASPSETQFYVTSRGGRMAFNQPTTISSHATNSIVTGAHVTWTCRTGQVQPGVDTDLATAVVEEPSGQTPGTSVAVYPVCYMRTEPGASPATLSPKKLGVPIIGSPLIILTGLGIPFLSTGGTPGGALQPTAIVDANGPTDGRLVLESPCIVNFMPGTNLHIRVDFLGFSGTIKVVVDTIPEPGGTHALCDDPGGTADITVTLYSFYDPARPEGSGSCKDTLDNDGDGTKDIADPDCFALAGGATTPDTDGDGCSDVEELNPKANLGGRRDLWNPGDFFDVNGDKAIDVPNDILQIILAYNQSSGGPNYTNAKDHGGAFGPFAWNRATRDNIIDTPNDILPAQLQYNHSCKNGP